MTKAKPNGKPEKKPLLLTSRMRAKVQADTGIGQEAIRKFERGELQSDGLRYALTRCFRKFGLALPKQEATA